LDIAVFYNFKVSLLLPDTCRDFARVYHDRKVKQNCKFEFHKASQTTFEECLSNFKLHLKACRYPNNFIERSLTGVRFKDRRLALQQRKKTQTKVLSFVTTYHPAVHGLKEILKNNWVVIQNQPLLKSIYTKPLIISYKRGKSLKDMLIRVKI